MFYLKFYAGKYFYIVFKILFIVTRTLLNISLRQFLLLFAIAQYYWNKFVQIVAKTLKLCNDVESNPGPSKSERDQTQFEKFCEAYKKAHSSLFKKEAQKKAICHV